MKEIGLELRLRTRLEPQREPSVVTATEPDLFETPFLYVAGQGQFPILDTPAEAQLRRFIDLGGLLVFDDAHGGLDPAKWSGWAFGLGLSRLVMMKYRVEDIRHLMSGDLRFVSQFRQG